MQSAIEKIKSGRGIGSARGEEVTILNKAIRKGLTKLDDL